MNKFEAFNIKPISHTENYNIDMLENVASNLSPGDDFTHDTFLVKLIYRPSILENITNWRIFNDYKQIIYFLHSEDAFRGSIINYEQYEALL